MRQIRRDEVREWFRGPRELRCPGDYAFWELLNKVIQEEPPGGSDPTTLGLSPPSASSRGSRSIPTSA